jgi:hypothetical protein
MTQRAARSLYRCLLRLHPEVFRNEFADEMLWIFDQACAKGSVAPLFADALGSIARQWILRMLGVNCAAAEPISASRIWHFRLKNVALPDSSLPASRDAAGRCGSDRVRSSSLLLRVSARASGSGKFIETNIWRVITSRVWEQSNRF